MNAPTPGNCRLSRWVVAGLLIIVLFPSTSQAIDKTRFPQADTNVRERGGGVREEPAERSRGDAIESQGRLLPGGPTRGRWLLGVQADNSNTGVRVTRVVPDSPAWQNGLERNDLIVTVDGFQVGLVDGRLFGLDTELQLRGGRWGRVRLLVQDHRTGSLVNLDVQLVSDQANSPQPQPPLQPRPGAIRGRAVFPPIELRGKNAVLVVRVINISRPLGGLQPLAEQRIAARGPSPLPFALDFNPIQLAPGGRYALQVHLLVDDRRVLANDPSQYLLDRLDASNITVQLDPVRFDKQRTLDDNR